MAAGYPGRDLRGSYGYGVGSNVQFPYQQRSDGGGGSSGLLKRSLTELERQQQIQHALYLRSVKQRSMHNSPISPIDLSSSSSSSLSSSSGINFNFIRPQQQAQPQSQPQPQPQPQQSLKLTDFSFLAPPAVEFEKKSVTIKNQLQELERQLLLDDDEDEGRVSVTGSAATTSEWGEAMQQLISPSPSLRRPPTAQNPLSPSPTSSSSSSTSSSASCSPTPSTPSKQLLLDTATAISEGNLETAKANLAALKRSANPRGDPDQRLAAMMVSALVQRIDPPPVTVTSPIAELCSLEHQTSSQMLYDVSPCFKLGLMAANFAILDGTKDHSIIHVVDFDLGQCGQYASLINAIADRARQRSSIESTLVKITAVCDPTFPFNTLSTVNNLNVIGSKITRLAEQFGVTVRFNVLNRRVAELDRAALGCELGEALAVNFAFVLSRIADESVSPANPRDQLLRQVKSLEPNVVTIVEQEMNGNTAPFAARFTEACNHYGSILNSLDATMNRDNSDRARVEAGLARKAANSIARDGAGRVERPEVLGKWRARLSMAGFKPVLFGPAVSEPVKTRIGSMKANPGFTYKEEASGLGFGWMGRVLAVASAWR